MSYLSRIAESYPKFSFSRKELSYYARHILLPSIGLEGQKKLKSARILVVGAGGLGCPVLQALTGAGVGHLTIIDGDNVAVSNLSRQWLHNYQDRGENKANSAKIAAQALNPFIQVEAVKTNLSKNNARSLLKEHDIIIDATDDLVIRYLIDDICRELDRPWIHAALYRDNSQLSVFWDRHGASFRKLYPDPSTAPSCVGAGMLGASASLVGNLQALEAVKLITANGALKLGELLSINSRNMEIQRFQLPDISEPLPIISDQESHKSKRSITVNQLKQSLSIHESLTIIDLRKAHSLVAANSVSLSEEYVIEFGIPANISGKAVLICEEGIISSMLAEALSSYDDRVYCLAGGAKSLSELD